MEIIKNVLRNELNIRTQKNYPVEGVEFIDITPLLMQKEVLKEITERLIEELKDKEIDYIISPEARGFLFGPLIAKELNIGCIPVRKKGKLPPFTVEKSFEYEKEYGIDILELPKLIDNSYENKKFYIIDDIYATGNTIKSIEKAINELNGKVLGTAVIINITELNQDKNIFSLIDIKEEI